MPPADYTPPPAEATCAECGAVTALPTRLHLRPRAHGEAQDVLVCPNCLSTYVERHRANGGRIEARLDDGRVVRW